MTDFSDHRQEDSELRYFTVGNRPTEPNPGPITLEQTLPLLVMFVTGVIVGVLAMLPLVIW